MVVASAMWCHELDEEVVVMEREHMPNADVHRTSSHSQIVRVGDSVNRKEWICSSHL